MNNSIVDNQLNKKHSGGGNVDSISRSVYFDVLKAVAIIAVVLYHLGICKFGYLGVDVFLVVAGYFTIQSMEKPIYNNKLVSFVLSRVFRLLPLLIIVSGVCLLLGWLFMLPDDYENVAQSIVATNFFANNILQCITTRNYWDVVNEYKPLMHTWYVGLLMQFYITISLILFAIGKFTNGKKRTISVGVLFVICIASLLMYLFEKNSAEKFYLLPYRLFEFCAGGLTFYFAKKGEAKSGVGLNIVYVVTYFALLALLFMETEILSPSAKLLSTVVASVILLYLMPITKIAFNKIFSNRFIAIFGIGSYSIFVWHQVIFAFTRYSFTNDMYEETVLLMMTVIIIILSYLSYCFIEKLQRTKIAEIALAIGLVLTTAYSLVIYKNAGVVRDIPELEVVKGNVVRGHWATYCDRGYLYDKDFISTDKPHWLIVGNSFGRDWLNVILESSIADQVEVSYLTLENYADHFLRFERADIVFLSTLNVNEEKIENVKGYCSGNTQFYIIGEKNFGEANGQIYRKRNREDYLTQSIKMEDGYVEKNERLKTQYPDIYIDMIEMVKQSDGTVKVFTDDGCFISQDCRHLTKAGARYYAKLIDWKRFIE